MSQERFGSKVRWLREGQGVGLRELARTLGISPSYLSDIETGRRLPASAVSDRIASALGVGPIAMWRLAVLERLSERDLVALGLDPVR